MFAHVLKTTSCLLGMAADMMDLTRTQMMEQRTFVWCAWVAG